DLPVEGAADVAVLPEPADRVHEGALARLALEAGVDAHGGAIAVELVGRLDTGKHLSAGFLRRTGGRRLEVDARPRAAVAELPGRVLARVNAVFLASELAP